MSDTTLYIATTLDGKIAQKGGSLDWLFALANPNQIDHGYTKFIESIVTTIMGKNTYCEILDFGAECPYRGMDSYIATRDKSFKVTTLEADVNTSNIPDLRKK